MDHTQKTISPSDVLFALLRCWKGAVICALALALLCGMGGLLWGGLRMSDGQARQEELAAYEQAMSRYNTQKDALEDQLDSLTESVRKQRDYMDHSLLMALDPYDFYEGTVTLQLHTDYQILPGMTYQDPDPTDALRDAYKQCLESGLLLQAMAQAVEQDVRYMAELLVIRDIRQGLAVDVRYASVEGAALLLEQVQLHLEKSLPEVISSVAEHSVTLTDQGVAHRLDANLAATQQTKNDKLTETVKTFNTVKTRQNDLVLPTLAPSTWAAVGQRIGLLVLVGAVLGAALYLGVWLWLYSGGERLLSLGQQEALDIKALGFDRGDYTVADLAGRLPKGGRLLITGSLASCRRQQLAQELAQALPETQICCVDGITQKVEALEALRNCDRVLLAEVRFDTPITRLQAQKQLIEDYGKTLVGCLLLNGDKK